MAEDAHLRRLARGGMASLVGAVVSAMCGIALVIVVARTADKDTAGIFFAATSLFLIVLAVVELGTDSGLVRLIPLKLAHGLKSDLQAVVRAALAPVLLCSALGAALLWIFAAGLDDLVGGASDSGRFADVIRALAVFVPIAAAYDTVLAATRGFGSMRPTVLVENIGRVSIQVVAVAVVQLIGVEVVVLAVAWSLPYLAGLGIGIWWLLRLGRRRGVRMTGGGRSPEVSWEFWSFTGPRSFARIAQVALKRADIVMVAALASPAEAAVYTAATRFIVVGLLGVRAIQQVLGPQLSGLFARGDRDGVRSVFHLSTTWSVMLAWPLYLGCATLAPVVLALFGHGYGSGNTVVVILALAMLVGIGTGPVDVILLMSGRSWLSLANNMLAVVLDVGLNLVLIPRFGIIGAAVSWSVAIVASNLVALAQVSRYLRLLPGNQDTVRVAVSSLICFGVLPGAVALYGGPLLLRGVLLLVGSGVYAATLWRWRQRLALDVLLGSLRRRKSSPRGRHRRVASAASP
jgi:O-antigen/teichoic acid export membrane protein